MVAENAERRDPVILCPISYKNLHTAAARFGNTRKTGLSLRQQKVDTALRDPILLCREARGLAQLSTHRIMP